jgi:hypothetical protein
VINSESATVAAAPARRPTAKPWQLATAPWLVLALLAAAVTTAFIVTDNSATNTAPPYPSHQLDGATALWVQDRAYPIIWFVTLTLIAVHTWRTRRFSMIGLLFLGGTTMFWIEWPADWGSYLVYNRDFHQFSGWTSTWFQTYWKPVGVIWGYGVFFGAESLILVKVVPAMKTALTRVLPKVPEVVLLICSCAFCFYVADILGEHLMTSLGWYTYIEPVGPAWHSARGSISFVWPALPFLIFAVTMSLVLRADERGNYVNEKVFRLHQLEPGWPREFARLAVWIITMNVAIFIAQPLILCVGRVLFLHDSVWVP